jgi:hypothetical protein
VVGAGDTNNAVNGSKRRSRRTIILINAGSLTGTGSIKSKWRNGAAGVYNVPDGAGGGGAGSIDEYTHNSNASINIGS